MLTAKQKELRRTMVGGSDAPAILGLSPCRGPWDVWISKVRPDLEGPDEDNEVTILGSLIEPMLRRLVLERVDGVAKVVESDTIKDGWRGCTPDAIITGVDGATWGGELKTEGGNWNWDGWGEPGTDQVRRDYLCQSSWCMGVTDYDRWDVGVLGLNRPLQLHLGAMLLNDPTSIDRVTKILSDMLDGGCSLAQFRIYHCLKSESLEQAMRAKIWAWWQRHVIGNEPPPNDDSATCAKALGKIYKADFGRKFTADEELRALLMSYPDARQANADAERHQKFLENEFKRAMGKATELVVGDRTVATWKPNKHGVRSWRWRGFDE